VLFFVTTDCPLSNGYAPEMNRIEQAYAPRGVLFYAVQGDTTIPDEEVRRHAHEYGVPLPRPARSAADSGALTPAPR
jgi:hypothetical protein